VSWLPPGLFIIINQSSGDLRAALLAPLLFFVVGLVVASTINFDRGRQAVAASLEFRGGAAFRPHRPPVVRMASFSLRNPAAVAVAGGGSGGSEGSEGTSGSGWGAVKELTSSLSVDIAKELNSGGPGIGGGSGGEYRGDGELTERTVNSGLLAEVLGTERGELG